MARNEDVRFIASSIKLPCLRQQRQRPFPISLNKLKLNLLPVCSETLKNSSNLIKTTKDSINRVFISPFPSSSSSSNSNSKSRSLLCSSSLALLARPSPEESSIELKGHSTSTSTTSSSSRHEDQERVLISEVLIRNKDGEELERKDLEGEAAAALKACRPNSALTVREVQEDVHRIMERGYFCSCMPVAVDTRDGIRLVLQVEPNQEFQGLVCEGANVLPSKFMEDAFRDGYGKIVNIRHLNDVINSIDGWYRERGLFGMVSDLEILSGGIIRLQVSEAQVNNINTRFLDRRTGEPTTGKTRPETILRQLTTKKGQVYSLLQGKRDVETVDNGNHGGR